MDRRSHPRHKVNQPICLFIGGVNDADPVPATLVDISASGCMFESDRCITPGTEILVDLSLMLLVCTVRHCRLSIAGGTFLTGASIVRSWPKDETKINQHDNPSAIAGR